MDQRRVLKSHRLLVTDRFMRPPGSCYLLEYPNPAIRVIFVQRRREKCRGSGDFEWTFIEPTSISLYYEDVTGEEKSTLRSAKGIVMLKLLTVTATSLGLVSAAAAADLPRRQPPPPTPVVGKAPIGKLPIIGKLPGKAPATVAARG